MDPFKPIHVVFDQHVSQSLMAATLDGITEMLQLADVVNRIHVRSLGIWRSPRWLDGRRLRPYHSVDWYTFRGRQASGRSNQIDCQTILDELIQEPWQQDPHYDVMIVSEDLYPARQGSNFVLGVSRPDFGSVISTNRFVRERFSRVITEECFKSTVMHELGHVFGLVPESRAMTGDFLDRGHCAPCNTCIMRQGYSVEQWVELTADRMKRRTLCPDCRRDLRSFFA